MLTLLHLLAAFESTLLQRTSYDFGGKVTVRFASYLSGQVQQVRTAASSSVPSSSVLWVPQDSVLRLMILFPALHCWPCCSLSRVTISHDMYTQILGHCQSPDVHSLSEEFWDCTDKVLMCMRANQLQLETAKPEVLWCASPSSQYLITTTPVRQLMTS